MVAQIYNPFAGLQVVYPSEQGDDYRKYSRTPGQQSIDNSPFERMVDLWFTGFSAAVHEGLTPVNLTGRTTSNMTPGSIFDGRDSWRILVLMLVAIAMENDVEVVSDPARMMALANGLAAAGVPHVVEMLEEGNQAPIWNLSERLEELIGG